MKGDILADILVINAGSSSIKASIFGLGLDGPRCEVSGMVEGIGTDPHALVKTDQGKILLDEKCEGCSDHEQALALLLRSLTNDRPGRGPAAVGHRIVHGGPRFSAPIIIDDVVRQELEELIPLAPLHQPHNLKGIDAARAAFPQATQIACFDTAFHRSHPWVADTYALPRQYYADGIRRYGFHGLSYAYIARAMRKLAPTVAAGRMVVAHLGNGASLCAIKDGQAVDTTMGFTPLDGLPMGTRSGQIDPGVLLHLLTQGKLTPQELSDLLQFKSGLLGLSGVSSDMRDLLDATATAAKEAVDYYVYRTTQAIAAMAAAMYGMDGLVFTAGIGEHAGPIRERICRNLGWIGLEFDEFANRHGDHCIALATSRVSAWVVPTDEERMIAIHVAELLGDDRPHQPVA
jgi:acetate kinase